MSKANTGKTLPKPLDTNPITDEERMQSEEIKSRSVDERLSVLEIFSTRAVVPGTAGTYLLKVTVAAAGTVVSYIPFPDLPEAEGSYSLVVTLDGEDPTYEWVANK